MTYVSTTKATPTPLPMLAWWVVTPHHVAPNLKLLFLKRFNGDNIISVKFKKIPPQNITLWGGFQVLLLHILHAYKHRNTKNTFWYFISALFYKGFLNWSIWGDPPGTLNTSNYKRVLGWKNLRTFFWRQSITDETACSTTTLQYETQDVKRDPSL